MRPVQAENVILNKKNGTTQLVIPFHTDLSVALWPTIPGHTGALAATTSSVGMPSILGHPHPKPDIASKPKTAEAASNSRNRAFSSASKTTFS